MWRKTVLHFHASPNERSADEITPEELVASVLTEGVDVLAITDHNSIERCEAVSVAARDTAPIVIAGVEIDTDRGHLVVLAPGEGMQALIDFVARAGIQPDIERVFDEVVDIARRESGSTGQYRDSLILIGAHVDQEGSLLQPHQTLSLEKQVQLAMRLDAIEIVQEEMRNQYVGSGIKITGKRKAIIRASDVHMPGDELYPTWLYLPDLTVASMRHAFCVPEATIRFSEPAHSPIHTIESIAFDGGMHAGQTFVFVERANALIGAPSTGKSLVIDALRFAFGLRSPIEEVRALSESRLDRRLGEGTTVTVTGTSEGKPFLVSRTWGGAQSVDPPFAPIVFSQTELVRRAMEDEPAMPLLDVHCFEAPGLIAAAQEVRNEMKPVFLDALDHATQSRATAERVSNPEDGLAATKAQLATLAGSEELARRATEVGRLRAWRDGALTAITDWLDNFEGDPMPDLPEAPSIDLAVLDAAPYLARIEIKAEAVRTVADSRNAATETANRLRALVTQNEEQFAELETKVREDLEAAGFSEGSELLAQLELLRSRLEGLEADDTELTRLRKTTDEEIDALRNLVERGEAIRDALRDARGKTCTAVNASMRTFFARLEHDAHPEHVDGLLEQAKTGTYQRRTTLEVVRVTLDRHRLLEAACRRRGGTSG
jgi:hypothetical protein